MPERDRLDLSERTMDRICAWCGRYLGQASTTGATTSPVTHGICDSCRGDVEVHTGIPLAELLASLDAPVLLVDRGRTVGAANPVALDLMQDETTMGDSVGMVFECGQAEGGACGLSIHCSACAIRQCVEHTYETGEMCERVPATLYPREDASPQDHTLYVTTARVGNRVLLRVEQVDRDPR